MRKKNQQLFAFSFGIVFVAGLLALALFIPDPTPFQYTVFRVVLALAAAGVAAMMPGFLELTISGWLRAGGALAVFAIVYFYNPASLVEPEPETPQLITLVDSKTRKNVLGELSSLLQGVEGSIVDLDPVTTGWFEQCKGLAAKSPSLIVVHWHALRGVESRNNPTAEEDLLLGLSRVLATAPNVKFVIYSRQFRTDDPDSNLSLIHDAARRIAERNPASQADIQMVVNRITTAYWGERPSVLDEHAILSIITELVQ